MFEINSIHDIGGTVRAARRSKGMKQSELAEECGVATEWISRLEKNRIDNPGFAHLLNVMRILDLHIGFVPDAVPQPSMDFSDFEDALPDHLPFKV